MTTINLKNFTNEDAEIFGKSLMERIGFERLDPSEGGIFIVDFHAYNTHSKCAFDDPTINSVYLNIIGKDRSNKTRLFDKIELLIDKSGQISVLDSSTLLMNNEIMNFNFHIDVMIPLVERINNR